MLGLIALLFFAATGITVNHPDWFSGFEKTQTFEGTIPQIWLGNGNPGSTVATDTEVDKLAIAEQLRSEHHIRGSVTEFAVDEDLIMIGFNGPAYNAYGSIDKPTGDYSLTETSLGLVAIMNDLHKGRDAGTAWSWVIDISGLIMVIASLSGLYLILGLKHRKKMGLLAAAAGGFLVVVIYLLWVP
jgi:uncharacterized protein